MEDFTSNDQELTSYCEGAWITSWSLIGGQIYTSSSAQALLLNDFSRSRSTSLRQFWQRFLISKKLVSAVTHVCALSILELKIGLHSYSRSSWILNHGTKSGSLTLSSLTIPAGATIRTKARVVRKPRVPCWCTGGKSRPFNSFSLQCSCSYIYWYEWPWLSSLHLHQTLQTLHKLNVNSHQSRVDVGQQQRRRLLCVQQSSQFRIEVEDSDRRADL